MGMKTKIKTQLRLNGFNPKNCNGWSDFFRSGAVAEKSGSVFRFYVDESDTSAPVRSWIVDVWEPESSHQLSMSLSSWAARHGLKELENSVGEGLAQS